jgi:hypothetical protein
VIHAQHRQIIVDLAAAFDAEQRGDATRFLDAADIGRGAGELEILRVAFDDAVNDVDLLQRCLDSGRAGDAGRDINLPELAADMAGAQAGDIGVERPLESAAVGFQVDAPPAFAKAHPERHWPVIMAVDDGLFCQHRFGTGAQRIVGRECHGGQQQRRGQQTAHSQMFHRSGPFCLR